MNWTKIPHKLCDLMSLLILLDLSIFKSKNEVLIKNFVKFIIVLSKRFFIMSHDSCVFFNFLTGCELSPRFKSVLNRYRRGLETSPQAKTSKSGHSIFFYFSDASERRVWLSEITRVHFWTFSPVSFKAVWSSYLVLVRVLSRPIISLI